MRVAVVTPMYKTPGSWLDQCMDSVRNQTSPCTHFLVCDGDESFQPGDWPGVEFVRLPKPHMDNGNVARAVGSVLAIGQDFDAIAYLDADNWFEPDHLQCMADLYHRTKAAVCTAGRNLWSLTGELLGRCPTVDGIKFSDTSCLFFTRAAFSTVSVWYRMPRRLSAVCDRIMWKAIKDDGLTLAHSPRPTVNFRSNYQIHYTLFGKEPPPGTKHVHFDVSTSGDFVSARTTVVAEEVSSSGMTVNPSVRQRVSLCMIVKNEEHNLSDCLASVKSAIDEIIVVDTGSTDGTKVCASQHGAKVYDFTWVDNFAAARNESLRHATGDWVFWLDGDERLDEANLNTLRKLLTTLPNENNVYMMRQWSAPDPMKGTTIVVDQARLFRNLPGAQWRGRVHEQILLPLKALGAREVRTDIVIGHLGYQEPQVRKRKQERNMRLLHMDLQENPGDGFIVYNLGNACMDAGKAEEAIHFLKSCLDCAPPRSSYLPKAYYLLAGACHLLGRDDEALRYCRAGKKAFPGDVALLFYEGALLMARGDLAGARRSFEAILKVREDLHYTGVDAKLAGCRTRHNLGYIYRRLGLRKEAEEQWWQAIFHTPAFEPPWLALVELYLEQNRHLEAEAVLFRLEGKPYREAIWPALEARMVLARGDINGSRRILETALVSRPQHLWLRIFLADILHRVVGDDKAAEQHLRTVLALCPNEQQSRQKLAQLLANRQKKTLSSPRQKLPESGKSM